MSASLHDLQQRVVRFIEERDWRQFHEDPKNTLLALASQICLPVEVRKKLVSLGPKKAILSNKMTMSFWFLTQQGCIVLIKGTKRILNDS